MQRRKDHDHLYSQKNFSNPLGFISLFLLFLCFFNTAHSVDLNGRISSSFYGSELNDESYWRNYTRLNSTALIWHDNKSQSFSFHTNMRWSGNLSNIESDKSQFYIYNLYFKFKSLGKNKVYAGRQFAYNSLGSSLIDGLRINYRFRNIFKLGVFSGATVEHENPEDIQSYSKNNISGVRIEHSNSRTHKVAVNWLLQKSNDAVSRHKVGIDGISMIGIVEFYGKASYDILNMEADRIMARADARLEKWFVTSEFDWRKPTIDGNTLFSLIDADEYKGIRFGVTRKINRVIKIIGRYHQEFLTESDSWRTLFGIRTNNIMLAWRYQDGYGGENNGFQIQVNKRIRHNLDLFGSAYISRYLIQPETPKKIDAYSSNLSLLWSPVRSTQIMLEGQYLRNAIDNNDFRIFFKLSRGFSLSSSKTRSDK